MRSSIITTIALCCLGALASCSKSDDNKPSTAPDTASATPTTPSTTAVPTPRTEAQVANTPATTGAASAIPLYFERALDKSELETRSLRELSLMRNTIFARAGNPFRKAWLRDYFSAQPWYSARDKMDESTLSDVDWQNAKLIAEVERSFSPSALDKRKTELLAAIGSNQPTPEQRVELELISRRVGKWVGSDASSERSPLEDPSLLDQVLELSQLEDMSLKDLRILRNTIYARRGYVFKSAILTDYFENMDWYHADEAYTDDRLTSVDWKNIKLVKSVEIDNGGPLDDTMHGELDWFDAA